MGGERFFQTIQQNLIKKTLYNNKHTLIGGNTLYIYTVSHLYTLINNFLMLDMTQSKIAQHLFCHRKYILLQVMVKLYTAKKISILDV